MAQVKLLKIASDGVPLEFAAGDDITLNSFTAGSGPVMSPTGIDMNGQDVTDISDLVFTDPAVGTINQTAGALIADDIMAKERNNVMTTAGAVLFPVITDVAGQVDSLKMPNLAGTPTATPAFSSVAGYQVYDSTNKKFYIWDGTAWDDQSTVSAANTIDDSYTSLVAIAARDVVYISAADSVSPAIASAAGTSQAIGFATAAALITAPVNVRKYGILAGFTGLTAGARYYLSGSVAGAITATTPTGAGHTIVQVGYAKSATAVDIQFQSLGRRA